MTISEQDVRALRSETGYALQICKAALQTTQGDFQKAVDLLSLKGIAVCSAAAVSAVRELEKKLEKDPAGVLYLGVDEYAEAVDACRALRFNTAGAIKMLTSARILLKV